jgi:hypothetical protein
MRRKDFLKNTLLTTGAILLPNAIWPFDKSLDLVADAGNSFVSVPNLKRFKISSIGTKFFETELSILKSNSKLSLFRKYFISANS